MPVELIWSMCFFAISGGCLFVVGIYCLVQHHLSRLELHERLAQSAEQMAASLDETVQILADRLGEDDDESEESWKMN